MSKRVLIVDDSATARQAVRIPLQKWSYDCIEAVDGVDGLDKLKAARVDLIITDLNMPNLDGFGFISEARKLPETRFTPIVMLTTESNDDIKKKGKAAGATAWVVKPFQADQLLKVINLLVK